LKIGHERSLKWIYYWKLGIHFDTQVPENHGGEENDCCCDCSSLFVLFFSTTATSPCLYVNAVHIYVYEKSFEAIACI